MRGAADPADHQGFEPLLPDMVEEVRFSAEAGRAPALIVLHRKMPRSLLAQLRRVAYGKPEG